jgi:hypothetical protein
MTSPYLDDMGRLSPKGEKESVINTNRDEMRRLADRILEDTGRLESRSTGEACRRLVDGKTTGDETRDLVRELLRSAAEGES